MQNYKDYIQYVCKAYKGKPIEACKSNLSSSLTLKETFPWSINPKITVHIKNGFSIGKEKPLVIHCWSEQCIMIHKLRTVSMFMIMTMNASNVLQLRIAIGWWISMPSFLVKIKNTGLLSLIGDHDQLHSSFVI